MLSHKGFSESGYSNGVDLKVNASKYTLAMGQAGISLVSMGPLGFHLGFGSKFRMPNKPIVITADSENPKYEKEGTKDLNVLFGVDTGINFEIMKDVVLEGNASYYANKALVKILTVEFSLRVAMD
jgi:hypothetical protein